MKTIALLLLATLPVAALAVTPPPDGGYPNENTAEGENALFSLPDGAPGQNTALGFNAMFNTTFGSINTAVGDKALFSNTTGPGNTAIGHQSLYSNVDGIGNVAIGLNALYANIVGFCNVAVGTDALSFNTSNFNTAVGDLAMTASSTGDDNTAIGAKAMAINSGHDNTAVGYGALNYNGDGVGNVAVGSFAGPPYGFNGSNNILLGFGAGGDLKSGSYNIEIGNPGAKRDEGVIRLGTEGSQKSTFVAGIRTSPLASGVAVGISPDGQLGVRASSARFKEAIQPMDKASDVLLALKPVTFRYKKEYDPAALPQFGLVAEEVAKVDPDLVARDAQGKPYTVRYEEVNAMLLNEFLKEHRKVEAQGGEIAELKAMVQQQAAQLQKVNDRLGSIPPAPRLVADE